MLELFSALLELFRKVLKHFCSCKQTCRPQHETHKHTKRVESDFITIFMTIKRVSSHTIELLYPIRSVLMKLKDPALQL